MKAYVVALTICLGVFAYCTLPNPYNLWNLPTFLLISEVCSRACKADDEKKPPISEERAAGEEQDKL